MAMALKKSLLLALATAPPSLAQPPAWIAHPEIGARTQAPAAFDSARGRVVCVGGYVRGLTSGEVVEWDGAAWVRRSPRTALPGVFAHALTYDAARKRVVLFGGALPGNDTWLWDGQDWERRAPAIAPPQRLYTSLAYDPTRQLVVVFGGCSIGGLLDDTWEWDGTGWTARSVMPRPPGRSGHGLAWDPISQRVILFGGEDFSGRRVDTWAWDGTAWASLSPAAGSPPPIFVAMATDPVRGRIVLLSAPLGGGAMETWEWGGTNWSRVATTVRPVERQMGFAADGRGGMVAGFGFPDRTDTWRYDGADWSRLDIRFDATTIATAAAHDVDRARAVTFGRSRGSPGVSTWEWDGHRWYGRVPANSPSEFLVRWCMAYDRSRRRAVLFGGSPTFGGAPTDDLWEWDGNDWLLRNPQTRPSPRGNAELAYDTARARLVLFGGSDASAVPLGDTWEWDGNTWSQRFPANQPSPRSESLMGYDELRQRVVLFGDRRTIADTWEWDGNDWTQRNPANSPRLDVFSAMTWDPARQRLVVAARDTSAVITDLWEWDGNDWTRLPSAPVYRFSVFGADPARQRLLLVDRAGDSFVVGTTSATATEYGNSCAGSAGVPLLYARGVPSLANAEFALELACGRANAPAVALLALAPANVGLGPCTLLVDPQSVALPVTVDSSGFGVRRLPIPVQHSLVGGKLWTQCFVLDPLGAFAGLFSMTNGVELTIGD